MKGCIECNHNEKKKNDIYCNDCDSFLTGNYTAHKYSSESFSPKNKIAWQELIELRSIAKSRLRRKEITPEEFCEIQRNIIFKLESIEMVELRKIKKKEDKKFNLLYSKYFKKEGFW